MGVTRQQKVGGSAHLGRGPQRRGNCASQQSAANPSRAAAAPEQRATHSSEARQAPRSSLCSIFRHLRVLSKVRH